MGEVHGAKPRTTALQIMHTDDSNQVAVLTSRLDFTLFRIHDKPDMKGRETNHEYASDKATILYIPQAEGVIVEIDYIFETETRPSWFFFNGQDNVALLRRNEAATTFVLDASGA